MCLHLENAVSVSMRKLSPRAPRPPLATLGAAQTSPSPRASPRGGWHTVYGDSRRGRWPAGISGVSAGALGFAGGGGRCGGFPKRRTERQQGKEAGKPPLRPPASSALSASLAWSLKGFQQDPFPSPGPKKMADAGGGLVKEEVSRNTRAPHPCICSARPLRTSSSL